MKEIHPRNVLFFQIEEILSVMEFIEFYPEKIPTLGDGDVTNGRRGPHGHRNDVNVARDSEKEKYGGVRELGR